MDYEYGEDEKGNALRFWKHKKKEQAVCLHIDGGHYVCCSDRSAACVCRNGTGSRYGGKCVYRYRGRRGHGYRCRYGADHRV